MALTEEQLGLRARHDGDAELPAGPKALDQNPFPQAQRSRESKTVDTYNAEVKAQLNGHQNGIPKELYVIPLNDQLAFTPRKLRVITVGAGFSGLLMAHKFQHRFPEMDSIIDHTIYEKRHEVGGTWLVNTYPGVQCDVPSHIYVSQFLQRALKR